MALHVQLQSDLGIILDLDATPYGVNPAGGSLGTVDLGAQYTNVWQRGYRPLVSQNYGNREVTLSIQLRGTSHDDLHTNYRLMAQVIAEAASYHVSGGQQGAAAHLCVQLPGATNTTTYDLIGGQVPEMPLFQHSTQSLTSPYVVSLSVVLWLKPWGATQALTRASKVVAVWGGGTSTVVPNAQVLSITPSSNMTREAPIRLTFQQTLGGSVITNLPTIIARRSKGNVANWTPHLQAEIGTASNYTVTSGAITSCTISNVANASAQGGTLLVVNNNAMTAATTSGVAATWTLNKHVGDMSGRHRAYLNVEKLGRCHSPNLTYGGASGDTITLTTMEVNVGHNYMGIIEIPDDVLNNAFKIQLHVKIAAGVSNTARYDSLTLVPIDEQYFSGSGPDGGWTSKQLIIDGLSIMPQVTLLDSSGDMAVAPMVITGQPPFGFSLPPRPTRFIALTGASNSTQEFTLTADYPSYTDWLL